MEKVVEELAVLKTTIQPVLSLLEEFKAIRKARRISEDNPISLLSVLTLNIKEDIITTVRTIQVEDEKRMGDIEDSIKDTQKELRDKLYDHSQSVISLEMDLQNLGDLISRQGNFIELQTKSLDNLTKDLSSKISATELNDLQKQLKKYTPLIDFHTLSNQVTECASKPSVDLIRKDLVALERRVKIYATSDELNEVLKKSEEKQSEILQQTYVKSKDFEQEKHFTEKRCDGIDEDISALFKKVDQLSEFLKKKVKEMLEMVSKKPWMLEVQGLQDQLEVFASKAELSSFLKKAEPRLASFSAAADEIIAKTNQFEKIIERYDEILLDKASKDDIAVVASKLNGFTPLESHKELYYQFNKQQDYSTSKFKESSSKITEIFQSFSVLSQRFESIRHENQEVSSISSTLHQITQKLSEKADKSDIYLIYDAMGRKEDIASLSDSSDLLKKQIETTAVILHALCRTMLKGAENPSATRKQRFDLYRNLTNLVGWMNGEDQKDVRPAAIKSPIYLKTDISTEGYTEALNSARVITRIRKHVLTLSPKNRTMTDFFSLPPIL